MSLRMIFHRKSQIGCHYKMICVVDFAEFAVYHTVPATYFHTFRLNCSIYLKEICFQRNLVPGLVN